MFDVAEDLVDTNSIRVGVPRDSLFCMHCGAGPRVNEQGRNAVPA
jgi:hypothetical protein